MTAYFLHLSDLQAVVSSAKRITAADFRVVGDWSVTQSTLRGGLREGVETITVHSGRMQFVIVPTRGMGLRKAWCDGVELGWESPIDGPVHPAFVDLGEPSGLGWLDGFDELLVRCGLESNGAPEFDATTGRLKYPLHGRIANRPAHGLLVGFDAKRNEISVRGVVEETRFHFARLRLTTTYTVKVGSAEIGIHDEIENLSAREAEAQLLYHINFGRPLLDAGSKVVVPYKTLVPRTSKAAAAVESWDRYAAPQTGFEEEVFFFDLHADESGRTRTLLKNGAGTQGVSVGFSTQQLPCFTLWKDTGAEADGYVTGLEPGTNYPNPRSFEGAKGRVKRIAPGEKATFDLSLTVHATAKEVSQGEADIAKIVNQREQTVHSGPQSDWCAP